MTRAKDISKILTDADLSGTLDVTGTVTANELVVSQETPKITITDTGTGSDHELNGASSIGNLTLNFDKNDDGSSPYFYIQHASTKLAAFRKGGDISFYEDTGTTPKFFWDASVQALSVNESTIISGGTAQTTPSIQASDGGTAGAGFGVVSANDEIAGQLRIAASSQNAVYLEADPSNQRADSWIGFRVDGSNVARFDSSGNFGIGTSSPADRFHVKLSSGQRVARFESNDSTSAHIAFKAPNTSLMPTVGVKDEAFYISTNDAVERMRITDSGIVAFNNSDTLGTYAFWLSDAKNSSSSTPCANNGITIVNNEGHPSANDFHHGITFAGHYTAPNRTRAGIFFQSTANNHTGAAFIIATRGAADASELTFADQKVKIGADGNFQATDTSISSLSDERLKQNIEDFTYDIEKFKKYKPKTFQWKMPEFHGGTVKEDSSVDQFTQRGFVAQDIESIDDYWLAVDTMNSDHPEYDYVKDDPNVKTSKLGKKDAMYVSVIQQLLTRIETLETANTALEARIVALETA